MMSNNSKKKVNSSPDRHTFQKASSIAKLAKDPTNTDAADMVSFYDQIKLNSELKLLDPEWRKDNLEYDLRTTEWICNKCKESNIYAQHLYAALCNNDFQKLEVIPILTNKTWSCSWRYAGGILSDMVEEGDYIDYYCSSFADDPNMVSEGVITDEIKNDLNKIGWVAL